MLTFISLFAGIGGMDLGLERAGMQCVAQVEIDDYATRVLTKHWPDVPKLRDVRTVGVHNLPRADLICGGFPCQDISNAGKRAGITGERSGLWSEFARIVRELRPRYVLVENVAALLHRGVDVVLGDLAACGYNAEWQCLPAAAIGAPHRRDRLFIVAYTNIFGSITSRTKESQTRVYVPFSGSGTRPPYVANAMCSKPQGGSILRSSNQDSGTWDTWSQSSGGSAIVPLAHCFGRDARQHLLHTRQSHAKGSGWWAAEPDVGRVAHGVPARVDRLRGLGNAVVPQVTEYIGGLILAHAGA